MADLDRVPSTTAYVVATAIIAGVTGYFLGQGSSLGLFSVKEKEGWPNSYNVKVHRDSSDEEFDDEEEESDSEEEGDGGELANFDNNNEEVKLVLVVRTDLGMTKGKFFFCCPQCATAVHSTLKLPPALLQYRNTQVYWTTLLMQSFNYRKNRRPVLARDPRLLQIPDDLHTELADPAPLGKPRTSEDCAADQIGGGIAVATGAGHQSGTLRAGDPGRWTHADC